MTQITFITGNQHKADQYEKLLGFEIAHKNIDLDEIQSTNIIDVATHKIEQAYQVMKQPVIIDDFGFCIDELNDLPGPFTKFFIEPSDGLEKLCLITNSLKSRKAKVVCAIAYKDANHTKVFVKELIGKVSNHPRGERGIGTDMIFEPDGYDGKTRAELSAEEYDKVYLKVRPVKELKDYLRRLYG